MPLGMEVGLNQGDFVLDGDQAPYPKGVEPQIFGPCLLWPNGCMDQDATWYVGRPQPKPHFARWGPSSPFLAHVCCAQTAGWIKMPLGVEVGLEPSNVVLNGDPAPPVQKGLKPPYFRPMYIVAKRLHGS